MNNNSVVLNTSYDDKLKQVECIKKHDFLLPFVGTNYDKYRILQIAESRYLYDCKLTPQEISDVYTSWFQGNHQKILSSYHENVDTRSMFERYLSYTENYKGWAFPNFATSVAKGLGESISRENVNNFAFMNFYQLPFAAQDKDNGMNYSKFKGLLISTLEVHDINELWKKCCREAVETVNAVVEILQPNLIFFTSTHAYNQYQHYTKEFGLKRYDSIRLYHSSDNRWWYRTIKGQSNSSAQIVEAKVKGLKIE